MNALTFCLLIDKNVRKGASVENKVSQKISDFFDNQRSMGENNRLKMLQSLANIHPTGRTTQELVADTGLNRETIYTHGEILKRLGYVKKNGKFGRYELTTKAFEYPESQSWIFGGQAPKTIMKQGIPIHNKFIMKQIPKQTPWEEESLFLFAAKMGALITYVMLQAIRPRKITITTNNKEKRVFLTGKNKADLLEDMLLML